jgi:hypothetical protein
MIAEPFIVHKYTAGTAKDLDDRQIVPGLLTPWNDPLNDQL